MGERTPPRGGRARHLDRSAHLLERGAWEGRQKRGHPGGGEVAAQDVVRLRPAPQKIHPGAPVHLKVDQARSQRAGGEGEVAVRRRGRGSPGGDLGDPAFLDHDVAGAEIPVGGDQRAGGYDHGGVLSAHDNHFLRRSNAAIGRGVPGGPRFRSGE